MTGRIRSLDAFRGLTVAAMILVNNPGKLVLRLSAHSATRSGTVGPVPT